MKFKNVLDNGSIRVIARKDTVVLIQKQNKQIGYAKIVLMNLKKNLILKKDKYITGCRKFLIVDSLFIFFRYTNYKSLYTNFKLYILTASHNILTVSYYKERRYNKQADFIIKNNALLVIDKLYVQCYNNKNSKNFVLL